MVAAKRQAFAPISCVQPALTQFFGAAMANRPMQESCVWSGNPAVSPAHDGSFAANLQRGRL
jgi:hypothetical protein